MTGNGNHGEQETGQPQRKAGFGFLQDLFVLVAGQIGARLLTFLAFAWLARALGREAYGALEVLIALTAFAALVVEMGIGSIGVRRLQDDPRVIRQVPALRLVLAVLVIPVLLAVGAWLVPGRVWPAAIMASTLLLLALKQDWVAQGVERMDRFALSPLIQFGLMAVLIISFVSAPEHLVYVAMAEWVSVAAVVAFFLWSQRKEGFAFGLSLAGAGPLLREAAPLGLSKLVWGVTFMLPATVVAAIVGLAEAALFAASMRLVVSLQSLSQVYHFNLFATLARQRAPQERALLSRASFRLVAWVLVGPALVTAIFARPVLTLVFGAEFAAGAAMLAILALALPIQFLGGHARWALVVAEESRAVLVGALAGAAAFGVLAIPLTSLWGGEGMALGVVLSALTVWMVADLLAARHGLGLARPTQALWPLLAGLLAAGVAVWFADLGIIGWLMGIGVYLACAIPARGRIIRDLKLIAAAR